MCYYFVIPASASSIQVQFDFSSLFQNTYVDLDNVTLNSTNNLIENGGFEIYSATNVNIHHRQYLNINKTVTLYGMMQLNVGTLLLLPRRVLMLNLVRPLLLIPLADSLLIALDFGWNALSTLIQQTHVQLLFR